MNGKLKKDKIDVIHLWRRYNTLHLRQKGGLFSLRQTLYGNPLDEDKLHSAKPGPDERMEHPEISPPMGSVHTPARTRQSKCIVGTRPRGFL